MADYVPNRFNKPYTGDGEHKDRHRRLKAVIVDLPALWDLFIEGTVVHKRCIKGLPKGARFIGSETTGNSLSTYFIFEHDSFEPVPSGHWIPVERVFYEDV